MSTDLYDSIYSKGEEIQNNDADAPVIIQAKLEDITEVEGPYGAVVTVGLTSKKYTKIPEVDKYNDSGLLVRRRKGNDNVVKSVSLEIRSRAIHDAIAKICGESWWIRTSLSPIIIDEPYLILFHHRAALREYAGSENRTEDEKMHMKLLTDFMTKEHRIVEKEYERFETGQTVSFLLLWTLFRPEEEVLIRNGHFTECGVICSLRFQANLGWTIGARGWDYNGTHFGPVDRIITIKQFDGLCDITTLEVYPSRFDKTGIRDKLIERGKKWKCLLHHSHREYQGLAWIPIINANQSPPGAVPGQPLPPGTMPSISSSSPSSSITIHISGRVMLDYTTYHHEYPSENTTFSTEVANIMRKDPVLSVDAVDSSNSDSSDKNFERFMIRLNDSSYKMSDDQAVLCPARIRGFSLTDKKFVLFLVDNVKEIQWRPDAWDNLEIHTEYKYTINALISEHNKKLGDLRDQFQDFVTGKGLGLVLLFAGAPGLGKTLTAEVAAEYHRKPLYAITSGDIGDMARDIDWQIRKIFDRAKAWDAFLLLDEADVFLAERVQNDISRNSLVTVFLRIIEYYEGVIFLTTNRLTAFDPAFESRIQLRLFYPELTDVNRAKIWKNLLPMSRTASTDQSANNQLCETLGRKYVINGREIKNMIKVAMALAAMDKVPLSEAHFERVARMNEEWVEKKKRWEAART